LFLKFIITEKQFSEELERNSKLSPPKGIVENVNYSLYTYLTGEICCFELVIFKSFFMFDLFE